MKEIKQVYLELYIEYYKYGANGLESVDKISNNYPHSPNSIPYDYNYSPKSNIQTKSIKTPKHESKINEPIVQTPSSGKFNNLLPGLIYDADEVPQRIHQKNTPNLTRLLTAPMTVKAPEENEIIYNTSIRHTQNNNKNEYDYYDSYYSNPDPDQYYTPQPTYQDQITTNTTIYQRYNTPKTVLVPKQVNIEYNGPLHRNYRVFFIIIIRIIYIYQMMI